MSTVVAAAKGCVPHVLSGVTMLNASIAAVVALIVGAGIGWYVGKMGYSRVITEIQNDIQEIKTAISAAKPAS